MSISPARPPGLPSRRTGRRPATGRARAGGAARAALAQCGPDHARQLPRSRRPRRSPGCADGCAVRARRSSLIAVLIPITSRCSRQDYGLPGAVATSLAFAQAAPLLLAVTRPLPAWWIVLHRGHGRRAARAVHAARAASSWPWPADGDRRLSRALSGPGAAREPPHAHRRVGCVTGGVSLALGFVVAEPQRRHERAADRAQRRSCCCSAARCANGATRSGGWPSRRRSARPNGPGARCWRSAPVSPASCTTWSPTTCR